MTAMSHTRRTFIKTTTAAAAGAAVLSSTRAFAQGAAKFVRLNVNDPRATSTLASYKKAVRAMLALPPADPRNWYRNALVHTLDCPHGNWWFLPWHRGYLGWFEQTCRELSGDPSFAMPYWDWSEQPDPTKPFQPRVPASMFDDVLTPTNPAYISAFKDFEAAFKGLIGKADYWTLSHPFEAATQYGQLLARGLRFNEDLWFDIAADPRGKYFYELAEARGLTQAKPELDEDTRTAVSRPTLLAALRPADFVSFGSSRAPNHGASRGSAPLESGPHNLIHNNVGGVTTVTGPDGKRVTTNVGGFMQDLMSPVDPLFFLHHANIDRLWDVWTRKQQNRGLPILPDGYLVNPAVRDTDYYRWSTEPFLFFVNAKGQAVSQKTAGDYASIGAFNYEYQPGSGEEVVALPPKSLTVNVQSPALTFQPSARVVSAAAPPPTPADTAFDVPAALLAAATPANPRVLLAKITVDLSSLEHASRLRVFVNAPAGDALGPASPHHAGTFAPFGHRHSGEFTFTIPLSIALATLRSRDLLDTTQPLRIRVVEDRVPMAHLAAVSPIGSRTVPIISMVIEALQ